MKLKKEYNDGCLNSGLKLTAIFIVMIWVCVCLFGCATTKKDGCINQKKFDKFNNSKFNK